MTQYQGSYEQEVQARGFEKERIRLKRLKLTTKLLKTLKKERKYEVACKTLAVLRNDLLLGDN